MGGMGLIFTPVLVRRLLGPLGLSGSMISTLWTHSYPNSPNGRHNPPLTAHPPLPPTLPPKACLLIRAICDITIVVKRLLKIHQC